MRSLLFVPLHYLTLGLGGVTAALVLEVLYRLHSEASKQTIIVPVLWVLVLCFAIALIRYVVSRSFLSGQSSASETTDAEQIFAMSPRQEAVVTGDNPIRLVEDDALDRHLVAYSFAQQVLTSDAREGLVVGVLGPWGSGKTSF